MSFFERVGTDVRQSAAGGQDFGPDPGASPYGKAKRYATSGDSYWGAPGTAEAVEPGFYRAEMPHDSRGVLLTRMETSTDAILRLPDPVCDMLLAEFVKFWTASPQLIERGVMVKRGLLLWGPPGSGKTSAINLMASHMIREMRGVVLMVDHPGYAIHGIHLLRCVEPDRPVILVYEDLDALVERYGEGAFLAMLDGEHQISGVVNVATTNYPERLDRRFVDRPGRFDRVTECPMPARAARLAYLEAKAPDVDLETRETWADVSEGWSLAHLRELIVAHLGLGEDAAAVISRMSEMRGARPNSEHRRDRPRAGFAIGEAA